MTATSIKIFAVAEPGGEPVDAFVIDGRDYRDDATMASMVEEAMSFLDGRGMLTEIHTFPLTDQNRFHWLPRWPEYRDRFTR